jgi:signal transduction histidine kinase
MALGVLAGTAAIIKADDFGLANVLGLFVGWSFVASGIAGWVRRPENDVGLLMVLVGAVWFLAALLKSWHASIPFTAGIWLGDVWVVPLAFLLAGFPALRLAGGVERLAIAALVLVMGPLEVLWLMCLNFATAISPEVPANALLVWDAPDAVTAIDSVQRTLGISALLALAFGLVRRWRRASAPLRRALTPVLAGAAALVMFTVAYTVDWLGGTPDTVFSLTLLVLTAVPLIFLAGLLRARLARSAVGDLLVDLREPAAPGKLRDSLARALRDPTLRLAYWVPEYDAYVGMDGEPLTPGAGQVTTFVERSGAPVAALVHDATLAAEPELVGAVTSAAGIALENERLQADLRARLSDLRASRARIVEAGDTARRKLERDLHDGAQQRLVSISVVLRLIAGKVAPDSAEAQLLANAREELAASLEELRNLAQGIHPAVLSDHGLEVAVESLAARTPLRVVHEVRLEDRPPAQVEVAAYYVIAEALTNVAKYADAQSATVRVAREHDTLVAEVADDGCGGADPASGSGLRGLADRVEALGGRLRVWSPPGGGTRLRAEIPCA